MADVVDLWHIPVPGSPDVLLIDAHTAPDVPDSYRDELDQVVASIQVEMDPE